MKRTAVALLLLVGTAPSALAETTDIRVLLLPPQVEASLAHVGDYEDLHAKFTALRSWMRARGHAASAPGHALYHDDVSKVPADKRRSERASRSSSRAARCLPSRTRERGSFDDLRSSCFAPYTSAAWTRS